jgi:hypothetical protein
MAVPNTFASATTSIPLANLDANFSYYDTAYSISGTTVTFNGTANFGAVINTGTGVSTGTAAIELGASRTGSGSSYIDFHSVASTDNESRLIRNAGANGTFDITNTGTGDFNIVQAGVAAIKLQTQATTRMTIDSGGTVGIGVTPSAWGSTFKALQINYSAIWGNPANTTIRFSTNTYNNGTNFIYLTSNYATYYAQDTGTHAWFNAPSGTAATTATFTQAMTLDASGNLLVGSTTSYAVNGTSAAKQFIASSSSNGLTVARYAGFGAFGAVLNLATSAGAALGTYAGASNGSGLGSIFFGGDNGTNYNGQGAVIYAQATETWSTSTNAASLIFATTPSGTTATTEKMRIDSSGNVGIGTSSPSERLTISNVGGAATGAIRVFASDQGQARIRIQNTNGQAYDLVAGSPGATNQGFGIFDATSSATRLYIDSSGNVGIGTTSPLAATGFTYVTVNNGTNGGGYTIYNTGVRAASFNVSVSTGDASIGTESNKVLSFYTNVTTKMTLDTTGNLQMQTGAVMPYAPAPASISTTATLTNANIQGQIISATGTTYTITMPLGTTLETLATWATTNISYDFYVVNTASGTVTMAVNTGVTSLGTLTIATGVSAHFRIRRTAANTFVLYRLS